MIDIIQTPKINQVFLNTAPINIIVESVLGSGYYFKIIIHVNDSFYDAQVRPKINDFRAEIDFQSTIDEVFNQPFIPPTQDGITHNTELLKKIDVTVIEVESSTGIESPGINIPPFYIINAHQENNNIYNHLQWLSIYNNHIKAPSNGVISIPFFSLQTTTLTVNINNVEVDSVVFNDCFGVYNANVLLEPYNVSEDDVITITISDGTNTLSMPVIVYQIFPHVVNTLVIKNNYNAWEYFYCFGEQKTAGKIDKKSIKIDEYRIKNYQNISKPNYNLNTGNFHQEYIYTVNQVIYSRFLYLYINTDLIEVTITNKKPVVAKTKVFNYNAYLSLENNHKPNLNHAVQYVTPPSLNNLEVDGVENVLVKIPISDFLELYQGDNPLYISFPVLPTKDVLSIVSGTTTTAIDSTTKYDVTAYDKVIMPANGFGTPYDTFKFNIENAQGKSNTATASINLLMHDPLNRAPVISVGDESVFVDETSKTIVANVTEPDGDPYQVVWEQISGGSITINNQTTETLTLSNWNGPGERVFKITAWDFRGNTSEKTVKLNVMDYRVNLALQENKVVVYGGKPGQSVVLKFKMASKAFHQERTSSNGGNIHRNYSFRIDNVEVAKNYYKQQPNRTYAIDSLSTTKTYVFNSNGKIELSYSVSGAGTATGIVVIQSISGGDQAKGIQTALICS